MDSTNKRQPLKSVSNVVTPIVNETSKLVDAQHKDEDDIWALFDAGLDHRTTSNLRSDFSKMFPFVSDDSWIPPELRLPETGSPSSALGTSVANTPSEFDLCTPREEEPPAHTDATSMHFPNIEVTVKSPEAPARHMVSLSMLHPSALPLHEFFAPVASCDHLDTLPNLVHNNFIPSHSTRFPSTSSGPALQGPPPVGLYDVLPSIGKRKRRPEAKRRADHVPHPILHIPELSYGEHNLPGTNARPSQITFIHEPSSVAAGNTANVDLPVSNNQFVCLFPKRDRHGVESKCLALLTRENYQKHFNAHYKLLGYHGMRAIAKLHGKKDVDVTCEWCVSEPPPSGKVTVKSFGLTKHIRDVHFALNRKLCPVCKGEIRRSNESNALGRHERTKMHQDELLKETTGGGIEGQDAVGA